MKGSIVIKGIIDKSSLNREERIFGGFGSVEVRDRQGDFLPLNELRPALEKLASIGYKIPLQDSHSNHNVGEVLNYKFINDTEGNPGLYLTCKIYSRYDSDTDLWNAIKDGKYRSFSLGGKAGEKVPVCDEWGCYNLLKNVELWEFSVVETGANQNSNIDYINKLAKSHHVYKSYPITKYVQQCGNEWCVYSESGKRLGTHGSQEDAYKQLYAIEVNKAFRITYSKNGKKDFIGAADKNEVDEKVEELKQNGHKILEVLDFKKGFLANVKRSVGRYFDEMGDFEIDEWVREHWRPNHHVEHDWSQTIKDAWHKKDDEYERMRHIKKAKVYVKNPNEVPQGARLEQGPKGGQYYESSAKAQQDQRGLKPYNPEQLKIKVLTDFKRRSPGQGIEKSIESEDEMKIILQETRYGLVSAGRNPENEIDRKLTPEQIQQRHLNLKRELVKRGYVFTPVVGNYGDMEDSFLVMMHDAEEREVVEIGRAFNQDSVIFVEKGHNSMIYTTGEKAGKRLRGDGWQLLPKEQKEYYTQVNLRGGFFKFSLNFNWEQLLEKIMKAKVYIKNPNEAPKGVKIEIGPEGGHYYESEDPKAQSPTSTQQEPQREIGSKEYLPTLNRYIEENLKTPDGIQKLRSLNLENTLEGIKLNTNFANLMTEDQSASIRWNAVHRADMEHLYKLVNDKEAIIRQKVAERIDQNGLHIMLGQDERNPNVNAIIAQRIDLLGLEYIIDKWNNDSLYSNALSFANKRFPYVRFLTPMIDTFQKTGKIELPEQFRNYINDTMKNNGSSTIEIEATDEFYNLLDNGKYNEFHLESKLAWEGSSSSDLALLLKDSIKRQFGGEIRYHDAVKDMQTKIQELQRKYPQELVDNYVKIQKQLTKAYLDVMFPDTNEVTIFRGTEKREVENIKADLMRNLTQTCLAKSNSLSSWTLKNTVAENFSGLKEGSKSGIILRTKLPKDDIWSTFMSHAYMGNEREILVIGKDRIVDLFDINTW